MENNNKRRNRNKHRGWNNGEQRNNRSGRAEGRMEQRNDHRNEMRSDRQQKNNRPKFQYIAKEDPAATQKRYQAIQEFKSRSVTCPICSEPIMDMSSAIADKTSGQPMHFDCVMNRLSETEKLGQNEKICYIGQGRFGVLYFENPRDQRRFTIKKIIDWEEKDKRGQWRDEMSGLYSQVE